MGLCALELVTCCVPSMWCRVQPAYPLISVVGASGSTRRQACPLLTLPSAAHSCFGVSGAACLRKPPVREPMREPRQKCPLLLYDADFKVHGLRILACAARRPRFHLATTAGFGSAAFPASINASGWPRSGVVVARMQQRQQLHPFSSLPWCELRLWCTWRCILCP